MKQVHDRRRRNPVLLLIPVVLLALICADCAVHDPRWTPYTNPTAKAHAVVDRDGNDRTETAETMTVAELVQVQGGCLSCHEGSADPHRTTRAACVDCHGGVGTVEWDGREESLQATKERAHPEPRHPDEWQSSANPERSYGLLNIEDPEWIQFVNPGDLRVANEACGACHAETVLAVSKSLMATSAHFYGAAGYLNGIVSEKRSIFGESYSREGVPQKVNSLVASGENEDGSIRWRYPTELEVAEHSVSPVVVPLPNWEVTQPGNVFRIFEKGSRLGTSALAFNGLPVPLIGLPDKLEDPGRPNNRTSDRGLGTLNRVDLPLLNVHKTRLNDPHLGFLGTNDQPGDYRSSGCTACHMVYANDRDPVHSGPYARFGNVGHGNLSESFTGEAIQADPMIPTDEPGHPVAHRFTTGIPSSQCMVCHMHQPNSFVNSYYGFQMWAYETDGEQMWPEEEQSPTNKEWFERIDRNPEEAAVRGKWGDPSFLKDVSDLNPTLKHTQFSDYHGHGWVFRAVLKMDRKGNLLDMDGGEVDYDDPTKFDGMIPPLGEIDPEVTREDLRALFGPKPGKAVHLKDIHAEAGMHCVDCHFEQDAHGDGLVYSEYQAAIQVTCQDCHGTVDRRIDEWDDGELMAPDELELWVRGGPAAKDPDPEKRWHAREGLAEPHELQKGKTPFVDANGSVKTRFYKRDGELYQRSMLYPNVEWKVSQIKSTDSARADDAHKQQHSDGGWAHGPHATADGELVRAGMDCAACHTSWATSCFGCHLPQKANWRTNMHHFEDKVLRNYASYNPQVARDDVFMLGISPDVKDNRIAVVRSSSAVIVSSEDAQRRTVYKQVPTVAANGMSSQALNTHFAHTVRKTETRACTDCHLSEDGDNNSWMAQLLLLGTGTVNFFGMHAYVGEGSSGFEAVNFTEWDEPQAVIGSNLHRTAFPDRHQAHLDEGRQLKKASHHGGADIRSLQHRGEYLFTASGEGGFRVYDVANVANKDFSEKLVTSPVSPLGQDTHVDTEFATAVFLPTNNYISMNRKVRPQNKEQTYVYKGVEQNLHELYRYAYITDRVEGLVIVDVDTLGDGDPTNNFLERTFTFNPEISDVTMVRGRIVVHGAGGALDGAENLWVAGGTAYVCCDGGLAAVDISDPLAPVLLDMLPLDAPSSVTVQLQYAFVTDAAGLQVVDVMGMMAPADAGLKRKMSLVGTAPVADARHVYVARTYAYVSAGAEGLQIFDVERPRSPAHVLSYNADGRITDLNQIQVGAVNDSIYALLADGESGMHVISLVTPEDGGRSAYAYAPEPRPTWLATRQTHGPALAISRGLDRDRGVDESGNQVNAFGRIGGRPFNLQEMQELLFREENGKPVLHTESGAGEPPASQDGGSGSE